MYVKKENPLQVNDLQRTFIVPISFNRQMLPTHLRDFRRTLYDFTEQFHERFPERPSGKTGNRKDEPPERPDFRLLPYGQGFLYLDLSCDDMGRFRSVRNGSCKDAFRPLEIVCNRGSLVLQSVMQESIIPDKCNRFCDRCGQPRRVANMNDNLVGLQRNWNIQSSVAPRDTVPHLRLCDGNNAFSNLRRAGYDQQQYCDYYVVVIVHPSMPRFIDANS